MKIRHRMLCVLLALLLFVLAGCSGKENAEGEKTGNAVETEQSNLITGIYYGTKLPLPDGMSLLTSVTPYWDGESLLCIAHTDGEITREDGTIEWGTKYYYVRTSPDGVLESLDIPAESIWGGTFAGDELLFAHTSYETGNGVHSIRRFSPDGTVTVEIDDVRQYFANNAVIGFTVRALVPGEDGTLWIASTDEVIALKDGVRLLSAPISGEISSLGMTESGKVCVQWSANGRKSQVAELDLEAGGLGKTYDLPAVTSYTAFGAGCDFCYADSSGFWAGTLGEDSVDTVLLVDYVNSGVNFVYEKPLTATDAETVIYAKGLWLDCVPVLYRRGEDIDLDKVQTLTVAHVSLSFSTSIVDAIAEFNATHPGVRVVVEDFGEYETTEDPLGGQNKLARDMVTGLYKPDIVIGYPYSIYMKQVFEKGMYADLAPYLESDPLVNRENLFDCVERYFDDGKGGLWGLASNFSVDTVIARTDQLGQYAEQGYWTISDFLDFCDSLPDGVEAYPGLTVDGYTAGPAGSFLYNGAYMSFIDREAGTCSFDSPEFIRALNWLKNLPTEAEYLRTSPYADLDRSDTTKAYRDGSLILLKTDFSTVDRFTRWNMYFGTKDWTVIGWPASEERAGAGSRVSVSGAFAITSFSEHPDLAWELLHNFFTAEEGQGGLSALKPYLMNAAEEAYNTDFGWFFEGGGQSREKDSQNPLTESDLLKPGVITDFTPEDCEKLVRWIDEAGVPMTSNLPDELWDIIYEEETAFLSGVGTAEDCAKKIQSRVSLWLAEHY